MGLLLDIGPFLRLVLALLDVLSPFLHVLRFVGLLLVMAH